MTDHHMDVLFGVLMSLLVWYMIVLLFVCPALEDDPEPLPAVNFHRSCVERIPDRYFEVAKNRLDMPKARVKDLLCP